jgi:hypothetical protein
MTWSKSWARLAATKVYHSPSMVASIVSESNTTRQLRRAIQAALGDFLARGVG